MQKKKKVSLSQVQRTRSIAARALQSSELEDVAGGGRVVGTYVRPIVNA